MLDYKQKGKITNERNRSTDTRIDAGSGPRYKLTPFLNFSGSPFSPIAILSYQFSDDTSLIR